jgi:hypothetical protein
MAEQAFLLLLGFLLTSVVGGALGYYFRNRTWNHQFYVNRGVAEWEATIKLFRRQASCATDACTACDGLSGAWLISHERAILTSG